VAAHPDYQGDRAHWSASDGATATLDFDGVAIAWLGPVGATRGSAIVRLDGKRIGTVDLRSSSFSARQVVFVAEAATAGVHRLQIEVRGSGTRTVAIDGFVVMPR